MYSSANGTEPVYSVKEAVSQLYTNYRKTPVISILSSAGRFLVSLFSFLMKLFFIVAKDRQQLIYLFAAEAVLIFLNYFLFFGGIYLATRLKIHRNTKIFISSLFLQYCGSMASRLVILGFQSGLLVYNGNPENNSTIVICSWIRAYVFSKIFSCMFFATIEMTLSIHYVRDYEQKRRLWIPISILFASMMSSVTCASFFTFEWLPWYVSGLYGVSMAGVGVITFFLVLRHLITLNYQIKNRIHPSLDYSLSIRFQLHESLWYGKVMKNGVVMLGVTSIIISCFFIPAHVDSAKNYFEEETTQLFDCIYNILVALNGPIVAMGTIYYNEHVLGEVKKLFRANLKITPAEAGQVYFIRLQKQWERPSQTKSRTRNNHITLL